MSSHKCTCVALLSILISRKLILVLPLGRVPEPSRIDAGVQAQALRSRSVITYSSRLISWIIISTIIFRAVSGCECARGPRVAADNRRIGQSAGVPAILGPLVGVHELYLLFMPYCSTVRNCAGERCLQ